MRKRIMLITIMILFFGLFISCSKNVLNTEKIGYEDSSGEMFADGSYGEDQQVIPDLEEDNAKEEGTRLDFDEQYAICYTHSFQECTAYTAGSLDELNEFYEETKEIFYFWQIPQPNETPGFYHIGFNNAVSKYDEAFFENKSLVMIYIGTDTRCHLGVTDVLLQNDTLEINLEKRFHGKGYDEALREWIVFVEISKDATVLSKENVVVNIESNAQYSQEELDRIDKERLQEYFDRMGITAEIG